MIKTHAQKSPLLILACLLLLPLATIHPAHADDWRSRGNGVESHEGQEWRGRAYGWHEHEIEARRWHHRRYVEPGVVYAPPVVYSPPPQPGISLFFPLDVR